MKEQTDVVKLEFLLTLNDNIVVQRYFNVRNYNPQARRSLELMDVINDMCYNIRQDLKDKSVDYLMENYHQIIVDDNVLNTSNTDGPELFVVTIKIGDETICQSGFDAKLYPPKIRYTVDIRPQIKSMLRGLTDIFSLEKYTQEYMGYSLV